MRASHVTNMTEGRPMKLLSVFALPLLGNRLIGLFVNEAR